MSIHRSVTLRVLAVLALVIPAAFLAACGDDDEGSSEKSTTTAESAAPEVSDVWARQVQDRGAVYMVIKGGSEADALVKASVPADVAGTVELHETVAADSSMGGDTSTSMDGMSESTTTTAMGETDSMGGETTTTMAGGMMQMQPVDQIDIPAGGTVKLEPGGYHIMLLDVKKTLSPGDTIEVTLTFDKAGEQKVTAEVREA